MPSLYPAEKPTTLLDPLPKLDHAGSTAALAGAQYHAHQAKATYDHRRHRTRFGNSGSRTNAIRADKEGRRGAAQERRNVEPIRIRRGQPAQVTSEEERKRTTRRDHIRLGIVGETHDVLLVLKELVVCWLSCAGRGYGTRCEGAGITEQKVPKDVRHSLTA